MYLRNKPKLVRLRPLMAIDLSIELLELNLSISDFLLLI